MISSISTSHVAMLFKHTQNWWNKGKFQPTETTKLKLIILKTFETCVVLFLAIFRICEIHRLAFRSVEKNLIFLSDPKYRQKNNTCFKLCFNMNDEVSNNKKKLIVISNESQKQHFWQTNFHLNISRVSIVVSRQQSFDQYRPIASVSWPTIWQCDISMSTWARDWLSKEKSTNFTKKFFWGNKFLCIKV